MWVEIPETENPDNEEGPDLWEIRAFFGSGDRI